MSVIPPMPPSAPEPRPGEDESRRRAGRLLVAQSAALLGMIGAFTLPLPWKMLVLVLAVTAVVLGVLVWTASREVDRAAVPRAAAGAGTVLALLGLGAGTLPLAAWNETADFERCVASSVTLRAQERCAHEFSQRIQERTGVADVAG